MIIKVLGTGCEKCTKLLSNVNSALNNLNIDADVQKVEDFKEIISYGVMKTPGLVINDKVIATGRVLSIADIEKILK